MGNKTEPVEKVNTSVPIEGVFKGHIFRVDLIPKKCPTPEDPDNMRTYEVVIKQGAVAIAVWIRDTDQILMVRQDRPAMMTEENPNGEMLEIVAGKIDVEGMTPKQIAVKELDEEAGIKVTCDDLIRFNCGIPAASSPGFTNEKIYLYGLAVNSDQVRLDQNFGKQEEGEKTRTCGIPLQMIRKGDYPLRDMKSYAAVTALLLAIERGEIV